MNEEQYALNLKQSLYDANEELKTRKNHICTSCFRSIDELKKEGLNVEWLIKICNNIGLKAEYVKENLIIDDVEYDCKNLIQFSNY